MKIPLNIEKSGFVTVFATLRSQRLRLFRTVKFIVDTGSPKTFISEIEATLMNVPMSKLNFAEQALLAGTKIELAPIEDVMLSFNVGGEIKTFRTKIYVARSMRTGKHSLQSGNSLIGSDFLESTGLALYFNPSKKIAYLELEDEQKS